MRSFHILSISFISFFFSLCLFLPQEVLSAENELTPKQKKLAEIIEQDKKNQYSRIKDFLEDFDRGFVGKLEEEFEKLIREEDKIPLDDEVNIYDDIDEFNKHFDRIIDSDLMTFELSIGDELNADDLESGLKFSDSKTKG